MKEHGKILLGQTVMITGGARRLGKIMALAAAAAGADVIVHHAHSPAEAGDTARQIRAMDRKAFILDADLSDAASAQELIRSAFELAPVTGLINNAAIFKPVGFTDASLSDWNDHLQINLTAPFLISQSFAQKFQSQEPGRIVNIVDWRALRPGKDHFPYTISKSALVSMTQAMALTLAPRIVVNAVALGAILPPEGQDFSPSLIKNVPMQRWANLNELEELIVWLLSAPAYLTGEVIHLDGGRHLA